MVVCYSRPSKSDVKGEDYDREGRVTIEVLKEMLPEQSAGLRSGNGAFMKALNDARSLGVLRRTFTGSLGPATEEKVVAAGALPSPGRRAR